MSLAPRGGRLVQSVAIAAAVVLSAGTALPTGAAAQEYYTAAQAQRGWNTFSRFCSGCHGEEVIETFMDYPTAGDFYGFMSSAMPMDQPGELPPQQYADIVAWLLSEIGFPAADKLLVADIGLMGQIRPADAPKR